MNLKRLKCFIVYNDAAVQRFMVVSAESDQVQAVVSALLATQLFVVDLQVLPGTTDLASRTIAAQHLLTELFVELEGQVASPVAWVESVSRGLLGHFVQKGLSLLAGKEFEEP